MDHKPLLKLFGDCELVDISNPHLFSLKERTLPFRFNIVHVPRRDHLGPDAWSRRPSPKKTSRLNIMHSLAMGASHPTYDSDDSGMERVQQAELAMALSPILGHPQAVTWKRIASSTSGDPKIHRLKECVDDGADLS